MFLTLSGWEYMIAPAGIMNDIDILKKFLSVPFNGSELVASVVLTVALLVVLFFLIGGLWGYCWNRKWNFLDFRPSVNKIVIALLSLGVVFCGLLYYGSNGCLIGESRFRNDLTRLKNEFTDAVKRISEDEDGSLRQRALENLSNNREADAYRMDAVNKTISIDKDAYEDEDPEIIEGLLGVLSTELLKAADKQLRIDLSRAVPRLSFMTRDIFNSAPANGREYGAELRKTLGKVSSVKMSGEIEGVHRVILERFRAASQARFSKACLVRENTADMALVSFCVLLVLLIIYVAYSACADIKAKSRD